MGEVLIDPMTQPSVTPEQRAPEGSLSYRERLRLGLGRLGERSASFVNMAANIALAHDDLRLTRGAMRRLDEPYGGLIERQASGDNLSLSLESDIMLDFQREAARVGFTDVDAVPSELRIEFASQVVSARTDDVAAEIASSHPEWSPEEVSDAAAARVTDLSTLFGMDSAECDEYLAAQLEYHELQSAIPEIQTTLSELRAERNERLSRMGRVALRGAVRFASRVRDVPAALSARAMVAGMAVSDRIHAVAPEKRRKAFWGTAAGVAIAGIAHYVALRHGSGPSGGGYTLASSSTSTLPDHLGSVPLPTHVGTSTPDHLGNFVLPNHVGSTTPDHLGGSVLPDHLGTSGSAPDHLGTIDPSAPNHVGTPAAPDHIGTPSHVGSAETTPQHVGGTPDMSPSHVGTEATNDIKTSGELFSGADSVDKWPSVITVDQWNSRTHDGSLTGISHQMLVRSGVHNPTQSQVDTLIDALRPQAQPNGFLLKGQRLDLRPATSALHELLKK